MELHHRPPQQGWLRAIPSIDNNTVNPSPQYITYIVSVDGDRVAYLHASSGQLQFSSATVASPIESGDLCCLRWPDGTRPLFSLLPRFTHLAYTERRANSYPDQLYEMTVLRSLLLGQRILDLKKRRAIVESTEPLVISVPESECGHWTAEEVVRFIDDDGNAIDVSIDDVIVEAGERTRLVCAPVAGAVCGFPKNSTLDYGPATPSIVTTVLENFYWRHWTIGNDDRRLLNQIYGRASSFSHPTPPAGPRVSVDFNDGDSILLDGPQCEAWHRYMDTKECAAFVYEGRRASGKSLLACALVLGYLSSTTTSSSSFSSSFNKKHHRDLQLLLTPSADGLEVLNDTLNMMKGNRMRILNLTSTSKRGVLNPHVVLSTIEDILAVLLREPCPLQRQLESRVTRIIIDDAHRASEADLNAVALCFPRARLVLMADPTCHEPTSRDVAVQLAGVSALEAIRRKNNVPRIKSRFVYSRPRSEAIVPFYTAFGGRADPQMVVDAPQPSSSMKTSSSRRQKRRTKRDAFKGPTSCAVIAQ